jgi:ubiquinone/menaquinone biosynthesis C-methylase UbiE
MSEHLKSWNEHYTKEKSVLVYPDENLVRLLRSYLKDQDNPNKLIAVDLGCGSGRHIKLMGELGIHKIIGFDTSYNALAICRKMYQALLMQAQGEHIPIKDNAVDIVVSWGSLHYGRKKSTHGMLMEISRILKKSGMLFGTLRTNRDTFLKRGKHLGEDTWITDHKEVDNTIVSFYSEEELQSSLSNYRDFRYGIMERSTTGDIETIISHWFFWAKK